MKQHGMKHEELSPIDGEISPHIISKVLKPYEGKLVVIRSTKELEAYLKGLPSTLDSE